MISPVQIPSHQGFCASASFYIFFLSLTCLPVSPLPSLAAWVSFYLSQKTHFRTFILRGPSLIPQSKFIVAFFFLIIYPSVFLVTLFVLCCDGMCPCLLLLALVFKELMVSCVLFTCVSSVPSTVWHLEETQAVNECLVCIIIILALSAYWVGWAPGIKCPRAFETKLFMEIKDKSIQFDQDFRFVLSSITAVIMILEHCITLQKGMIILYHSFFSYNLNYTICTWLFVSLQYTFLSFYIYLTVIFFQLLLSDCWALCYGKDLCYEDNFLIDLDTVNASSHYIWAIYFPPWSCSVIPSILFKTENSQ